MYESDHAYKLGYECGHNNARAELTRLAEQRNTLARHLAWIEDECYPAEPKGNDNGPELPDGWRDWAKRKAT